MATKILLIIAAFIALVALFQMIKRSRQVYMRPMGYVQVTTRRTSLALALYGLAILLVSIGWIVAGY